MINLLHSLFGLFSAYPALISFLAPILGADPGVVLVAFFGSNGAFSLYTVFWWALVGTTLADAFWFYVPRTRLYRWISERHFIKERHRKIERSLEYVTGNRDTLILLLSKALIGTRVIVILFLSLRQMTFLRFLWLSVLVNALWTGVLIFVGFIARGSYDRALEYFENFQLAVFALFLLALAVYFALRQIRRYLLQREKLKNGDKSKP